MKRIVLCLTLALLVLAFASCTPKPANDEEPQPAADIPAEDVTSPAEESGSLSKETTPDLAAQEALTDRTNIEAAAVSWQESYAATLFIYALDAPDARFALADIDGDSVPELIIAESADDVSVFTAKDEGVVRIEDAPTANLPSYADAHPITTENIETYVSGFGN